MAAYDYVALNQKGRRLTGVVQADSEYQARNLLREQSLLPVEVQSNITSSDQKGPGQRLTTYLNPSAGMSNIQLVAFSRHLAILISSGIPVADALEAVAAQQTRPRSRRVILEIRSSILEGYSLSDSFAAYPGVFSPLFITMVKAGEQAGALGSVLERLADFLESRREFQSNIRAALVYPAVLTLVSVLVIALLMAYVVPKIVSQFDHVGQMLPFATRVLIEISSILSAYGVWIALGVFLIVTSFRWILTWPAIRSKWHRLQLKTPGLKFFVLASDYARLTRTMEILLDSGLPALPSLKVSSGTMTNTALLHQITDVAQKVEEGQSLSQAFQEVNDCPPLLVCMIANGEQTGELVQMFRRIASLLENDLRSTIKISLALFEPLLILMMGGTVLFIVMSILLPILELNNMTML